MREAITAFITWGWIPLFVLAWGWVLPRGIRPVTLYRRLRGDYVYSPIPGSDTWDGGSTGWQIFVRDIDPIGQVDPRRGTFIRKLPCEFLRGTLVRRRRWFRRYVERSGGSLRWIFDGELRLQLNVEHLDALAAINFNRPCSDFDLDFLPDPIGVRAPDGRTWNL